MGNRLKTEVAVPTLKQIRVHSENVGIRTEVEKKHPLGTRY